MRHTFVKTAGFAMLGGLSLLALWLWGFGGAATLTQWASEGQRVAQNAMAGALRRLKGGDPAALWALCGLCFTYGVFHAAGPGHGKLLIGGYGLARPVDGLRLAGLALVSSLAQSLTAVVLVAVGAGLFALGRDTLVDLADEALAPISYGAIALVGAWLALRGVLSLWRTYQIQSATGLMADTDHIHDENCGCGHAHAPTAAQAAQVSTWKDAAMVIGAIAIRPCTGALFVLLITWQMGILPAGILAAFAMGLGTSAITVAVAIASVFIRKTTVEPNTTGPHPMARWLWSGSQLFAGGLVCLLALQLLFSAL